MLRNAFYYNLYIFIAQWSQFLDWPLAENSQTMMISIEGQMEKPDE